MRHCFTLQVRPDLVAEYTLRHQQVWPEMLTALRSAGWNNYSLFLRPDGLLIGYVETPDLAAAQRAMERADVNQRWQAEMSRYFVDTDERPPDRALTTVAEVFHLEPDPAGPTRPGQRP